MRVQSIRARGGRNARLLQYAIPVAFLAWCALSFRRDVAQLSLAPLLRSWDLVGAAAALSLLNYLLRGLRWRYYLGWLGHRVGLIFSTLTFAAGFAYTLSPGKLGELARARYYLPYGIPVTDTAAAFFAERLLDIAVIAVLAGFWSIGSARYLSVATSVAVASGTLLILLAALPWAQIVLRVQSCRGLPTAVRKPLATVLTTVVSIRPLLQPNRLAAGFAIGLLAWGLEAVGLWLLTEMFPAVHLDLADAVGIYGLGLLAGGISMVPGGLGSTEAVVTMLLTAYGFTVPEALLITLSCRLVTLWLAVLVGWIAVVALRQTTPQAAAP